MRRTPYALSNIAAVRNKQILTVYDLLCGAEGTTPCTACSTGRCPTTARTSSSTAPRSRCGRISGRCNAQDPAIFGSFLYQYLLWIFLGNSTVFIYVVCRRAGLLCRCSPDRVRVLLRPAGLLREACLLYTSPSPRD